MGRAGATVEEIEEADKRVMSAFDGVAADLINEYDKEHGLKYYLSQTTAEAFGDWAIEHSGPLVLINYIAVAGHMHLFDWILEIHSERISVEAAVRMLSLSIRNSYYSEHSRVVRRRLMGWLQYRQIRINVHTVARFDSDDRKKDEGERDKDGRLSLLDYAIETLLGHLANYFTRDPSLLLNEVHLARCWETIDNLVNVKPPLPIDLAGAVDYITTHLIPCVSNDQKRAWYEQREPHVLRLLQLFARRGWDFYTAAITDRRRHNSTLVSHVLLDYGWMGCFEWMVETYNINVQGI